MHPVTPHMIEDAVRTLIVTARAPRADVVFTVETRPDGACLCMQLHLPDCPIADGGSAYGDPHPVPTMLQSLGNATLRSVTGERSRELRAENGELHIAREARSTHAPGTHLELVLPAVEDIDVATDACVGAVLRQPQVVDPTHVRIQGESIARMHERERSGHGPVDRTTHAWLEQLALAADPDPVPPRPLAALHDLIEREQRRGCATFGAYGTDLIRHQLVLLAGDNGPEIRPLACHTADEIRIAERCDYAQACLSPDQDTYIPEPAAIGVHTAERLTQKAKRHPLPDAGPLPRHTLVALLEHEARCARRAHDAGRDCTFEHPDGILGSHPHTPAPALLPPHHRPRAPRRPSRAGRHLVRAVASALGFRPGAPTAAPAARAPAASLRFTVDAGTAVRDHHATSGHSRTAAHTRSRDA